MRKTIRKGYTGPKVVDTSTFILKAMWQHGDLYDYSNVRYESSHKKVEVACKKHGIFLVTPKNHAIGGSGCPRCKAENCSTRSGGSKEEFISKARELHGDKYSYDLVVYIHSKEPVEILCEDHGPFWQSPNSHLRPAGCPACSGFNHRRFTTEEFIEKAKIVHGNKYNYTKVNYVDCNTKVRIICRIHGEFLQAPPHHLSGKGCRECSIKSRAESHRYSVEEFIEKSKEVHGDKYDYSEVIYSSSKLPVTIICPEHGKFDKIPNIHTSQESGCPECALRDRGWGAAGYYGTSAPSNLYVLRVCNEDHDFIKVGLSKDIPKRMAQINRETGCTVEKLLSVKGKANELFKLEQQIIYYSDFSKYKYEKPFKGHTELFSIKDKDAIFNVIEQEYGGVQ